jgi:hypothetical protein
MLTAREEIPPYAVYLTVPLSLVDPSITHRSLYHLSLVDPSIISLSLYSASTVL